MRYRRRVEIFSAGCGVCDVTIDIVNRIACESCEVEVLDVRQADAENLPGTTVLTLFRLW